jgi:hypothetical protein
MKSAELVLALEKATATEGLPPIHDKFAIGEVPTEERVTVVRVITWLPQYFQPASIAYVHGLYHNYLINPMPLLWEQGDMTRYSSKSMDEVPDKDSDNARRRTRPADHKPWSPAAIDRLDAKGKESPDMKASQKEYENQDPIDRHGPKYRVFPLRATGLGCAAVANITISTAQGIKIRQQGRRWTVATRHQAKTCTSHHSLRLTKPTARTDHGRF